MVKIHTTIGVYPNSEVGIFTDGNVKINGVQEDHLESHIEYNKTWRFGRALFVDGVCVYEGSVDAEKLKQWEEEIKSLPALEKCTAPYH